MTLKQVQKKFIKLVAQTGDHITSYQKSVPGTDRKTASNAGKRWMKKKEIADEIAKLRGESQVIIIESPMLSRDDHQKNTSDDDLTPKMKLFCEEWIIDFNATRAAISAGHSERSAAEIGSENLTKPKIQAYIRDLMAERSERTQVTADMVVTRLAQIAFADIDRIVKVVEKAAPDTTTTGESGTDSSKKQNVVVFPTDSIPKHMRGAIAGIKQGRDGIEVKVHDPIAALQLLGRHLGMWNDKLKVDPGDDLMNLLKTVASASDK